MSSSQMEEPNHIYRLYIIKIRPYPKKLIIEEADKQCSRIALARSRINQEIARYKGDENIIRQKLRSISLCDDYIKWKTREIKTLKQCLGIVEPCLAINSVPAGTTLCNAKELNDMIKNMAHNIQHGNKRRADEMKIYQEIRTINDSRERYPVPEPDLHSHPYSLRPKSKRDTNSDRSIQHKINIRLGDIEEVEMDQIGHKAKVRRLKADLELVKRTINSLKKDLEKVNAMKFQAEKRPYELGKQGNELKSCYNEYQLLKTNAKELVRKLDIVGLNQLCDTQIEGFITKWNNSKSTRDDYEKRKLMSKS